MSELIDCYSPTIPTAKKYRETQFSTVKKRTGRESIPFIGLDSGIHKVRFYNDKCEFIANVKTWLSPYGYAWKVLKDK